MSTVTVNQGRGEGEVASGLESWDFTPIAGQGFGDPLNAYAHTMAWFRGRLYVGTTRANLCLLKGRLDLPVHCWPVKCPEDVYDLDLRARIYRFDPSENEWRCLHVSPLAAGRKGRAGECLAPREIGFRAMTVVEEGPGEPDSALYVATWAPARSSRGPLILRSVDGEEFHVVSEPGLEDATLASVRTLVPFRGRLYTSPTGRSGGMANTPENPAVMECPEPSKGQWRPVSVPGFGDSGNLTVFDMVVFSDHLYAGTLNPRGYQIWKTRAEGSPPYRWKRVLGRGADRGPANEAAASMCVFNGALYVGSGIQNGGYDRAYDIGPAASELIRIYPDDSWELIVGGERSTSQGYKRPLSGFEAGFGSIFNGYFWRMAEYDGFLYLGTFNWSVLLPYLKPVRPGAAGERLAQWLGVDHLVQFEGGFDLFRSRDGVTWIPVTTSGFGNPYNYGARTMTATPRGLFIGTANPFGPEVAVRLPGAGWVHAPNPHGGAEIWLGRSLGRVMSDEWEAEDFRGQTEFEPG